MKISKIIFGLILSVGVWMMASAVYAQTCNPDFPGCATCPPHIYQGINCGANWYCGGCKSGAEGCFECPKAGDPTGATILNYVSCTCQCPSGQIVCSGACTVPDTSCPADRHREDTPTCPALDGCGACKPGYSDPDLLGPPNACVKIAYMDYANNGNFQVSGNLKSTAGDLYLASGKAIRIDGAGVTTFSIGNWGVGATRVDVNVLGGFIVGSPAAPAGGYTTGTLNAQRLCIDGDCLSSWTIADAFIQNGNSFGTLATLGTNDAFDLVFETSGTERMRIDTDGDVGIGTINPTNKLHVSAAGTAGFFQTSGNSPAIYGYASNIGAVANYGGFFESWGTTGRAIQAMTFGGVNSWAGHFIGGQGIYADAGVIGGATGGWKGTGTLNAVQLCIQGVCKSNWSGMIPGGADKQVQFNNAGVFDGDAGFIWDDVNKRIEISNTGANAEVWISRTGGASLKLKAQDTKDRITFTQPLYFDSDDAGTTRMAITTGGNVGIGTTAPGTTLDVNGVINAATGYRVANSATAGNYLRGDGTNFISSPILTGDLPGDSPKYIWNTTSKQPSSNFNISGSGAIGAVGFNSDYGLSVDGSIAAGYFKSRSNSGIAFLGNGDYGVQAFGNTAGGYFSCSEGSGKAYLGYGDYGLYAGGSAYAGYFSGNVGITNNLTVDTNTLYVDAANNRVGVGAASPSSASDQLFATNRIGVGTAGSIPGVIALYPEDTYAWWYIDNGGTIPRSLGRLRFSHGGTPGQYELLTLRQTAGTPPPHAGFVGIRNPNPQYALDVLTNNAWLSGSTVYGIKDRIENPSGSKPAIIKGMQVETMNLDSTGPTDYLIGIDVIANHAGGNPTTAKLWGVQSRGLAGSTGSVGQVAGVQGIGDSGSNGFVTDAYGVSGQAGNWQMGASGTTSNAYGVRGWAGVSGAAAGTVSNAYGVKGEVDKGGGTVTTGYGGYFTSTNASTNYGIYAAASGGATNWAGYFVGDLRGTRLCIAGDCRSAWPSGGTPGGADTQVQFNDGGSVFGGDSGLTYVKGTDSLTVGGALVAGFGAVAPSYGVQGGGTTMGGYFYDLNNYTYAYLAYSNYGGYFGGDMYWSGTLTGGSVPWARLTSFPAACPSGQFVTGIGGTLTCAAGGSGTIGGSGTANYLARFTGASTIGNSVIYDNGANVGIGTISPVNKLNLIGTAGSPTIPGASSTGVFRVGVSSIEGIDIGKMSASPFLGWIQVGYSGSADPLVLQPSGGNVGIGMTTTPTYKLYINGNGYLGAAAWVYSSDKRLKENISYLGTGLDVIENLKPAAFDFINGEKNQVGFIAQDVQEVLPDIVSEGADGMLGVKTESIIPYLVKAVQEQQGQIDQLKMIICQDHPTEDFCETK